MATIPIACVFIITILWSFSTIDAANFCKDFKQDSLTTPSGVYNVLTHTGKVIEVYCEMGLNGGGYTFLNPKALAWLTQDELSLMFTDKSSFLLRVQYTNGSQPYAVLKQLSQYSNVPLKLGLSNNEGYSDPVNINYIGSPFLYFGFLPNNYTTTVIVQGLQVNGVNVTYTLCGTTRAGHFALFPNFIEVVPSAAFSPGPVYDGVFSNLRLNPSRRVIPSEFFLFGEFHFGGCGCYIQTNQIPNVLSFAIGFR